jgi:uncharacterized protein (TIGR02757 family)
VKGLKRQLNRLYETFDVKFLSTDPLEFVHRFTDAKDQEIVGLIASSLAYGKVRQILSSVERVVKVMEWRPHEFTMGFKPARDKKRFEGFVHRFSRGEDIACLIYFAKQMIEDSGTIGGFFMKGVGSDDRNVKSALASFSKRALGLDSEPIYRKKKLPEDAGVRFFFPSSEDGSPCKRLNLYLRWMVRRNDRLDLGLWSKISPSKLVIPLDTHTARISRNIGLTKKQSPSWKMAEEITQNLIRFDPEDPIKYDFALCRLGMLEYCPKEVDVDKCQECLIREMCIF